MQGTGHAPPPAPSVSCSVRVETLSQQSRSPRQMRCSIPFISLRKQRQENPVPCFWAQHGKQAPNLPITLGGKAHPLLFKGLKITVKMSFPSDSKEI